MTATGVLGTWTGRAETLNERAPRGLRGGGLLRSSIDQDTDWRGMHPSTPMSVFAQTFGKCALERAHDAMTCSRRSSEELRSTPGREDQVVEAVSTWA